MYAAIAQFYQHLGARLRRRTKKEIGRIDALGERCDCGRAPSSKRACADHPSRVPAAGSRAPGAGRLRDAAYMSFAAAFSPAKSDTSSISATQRSLGIHEGDLAAEPGEQLRLAFLELEDSASADPPRLAAMNMAAAIAVIPLVMAP